MFKELILCGFATARLSTLQKPVNHFVQFQNLNGADENNYDFIVFTDPQYGKADKELEDGTDGLSWDTDIEHVTTMCDQLNENLDNLAFIMCTGDLAQAMPIFVGQVEKGSLPGLRPAQSGEFLDTMRSCPATLPLFTTSGNRDIGNLMLTEHAWLGYEKQFMQPFYHFKFGDRYYIAIDTQVYKLDNVEAQIMRQVQNEWLEILFRTLPKEIPKTVFMHTALYIEFPEEEYAAVEKLKSIFPEMREYLVNLFSHNGVDSVFSGHVHFENFDIEEHKGIRQYVMTAINHQNTWHSKETKKDYGPCTPAYYKVHVENGKDRKSVV